MLRELQIRNVALIEYVCISFDDGFCVLSGETGAGKSIIIDSINAVIGSRVTRELIKTGYDKAVVEAAFDITDAVKTTLDEYGIEYYDSVILYREIHLNGKNVCRINGRMVSVGNLHNVATKLVNIHGQHDNQTLLNKDFHIDLLDKFGGIELYNLSKEYAEIWEEHGKVRSKLRHLNKEESERIRELDMLEFQIGEINDSKIYMGEDDELVKRRDYLRNIAMIKDHLSSAYAYLSGDGEESVVQSISMAVKHLESIKKFGGNFEQLGSNLAEILYQLEDVVAVLRDENEDTEFNPNELEEIEERLELLQNLKKKYGQELADVLLFAEEAEKKKAVLLQTKVDYKELREEEEILRGQLLEMAKKLTAARRAAAVVLEKGVTDNLMDLEMKNAKLKVWFDESNRVLNEKGADVVEFLISANKGEDLKPLAKVASGGELARVMLAIKGIISRIDEVDTLIFDEIDSGLGGVAAQKTGMKLKELSKQHQVVCVTHQAQIASYADAQYLITKRHDGERTVTEVEEISGEKRTLEIARLLSGNEAQDISKIHAAELLEKAHNFKNKNQN